MHLDCSGSKGKFIPGTCTESAGNGRFSKVPKYHFMIKIDFQFTRQELFQGLMTIAKSRRGVRISHGIGILFIVASVLILAASFILYSWMLGYALVFLAFSLYIRFNLELIIWYQVKNMIKNKAQITEPLSYSFQESSYEFTGESFLTRMDYSKLREVLVGPYFILLKISEGSAHIMPRRAFSAEQFDLFKEIIQAVPQLKSNFKV